MNVYLRAACVADIPDLAEFFQQPVDHAPPAQRGRSSGRSEGLSARPGPPKSPCHYRATRVVTRVSAIFGE